MIESLAIRNVIDAAEVRRRELKKSFSKFKQSQKLNCDFIIPQLRRNNDRFLEETHQSAVASWGIERANRWGGKMLTRYLTDGSKPALS